MQDSLTQRKKRPFLGDLHSTNLLHLERGFYIVKARIGVVLVIYSSLCKKVLLRVSLFLEKE